MGSRTRVLAVACVQVHKGVIPAIAAHVVHAHLATFLITHIRGVEILLLHHVVVRLVQKSVEALEAKPALVGTHGGMRSSACGGVVEVQC